MKERENKKGGLTLRGSPSPLPESWSRREPPPDLGSAKSTAAIEVVSDADCLNTNGSSAAWKPKSDAKGMYTIRGKKTGTRAWGRIKGRGGSKWRNVKACFLYIPHVQFIESARGMMHVMGC